MLQDLYGIVDIFDPQPWDRSVAVPYGLGGGRGLAHRWLRFRSAAMGSRSTVSESEKSDFYGA